MTATLFLPPVQAAAAVNGLLTVGVLSGVTCPCFGMSEDECAECLGTVAPSVEAGQRLNIAATRDDPGDGDAGPYHWGNGFLTHDDHLGAGWGMHPGYMVGSAVAASAAVPIVTDPTGYVDAITAGTDGHLSLWHYRDVPHCDHIETDLSAALPWLGDPADLVGKWAVLLSDPATTEQRCPTCWGVSMVHCDCGGSTLHMGHPCPTCNRERACPPVPLPDGFDPEPYTLTELELT